jgi:hypothetical protein
LIKRAQQLYEFERDRFTWQGADPEHPLAPILMLLLRMVRVKQLLHAILTAKSRKQIQTIIQNYRKGKDELSPTPQKKQKEEVKPVEISPKIKKKQKKKEQAPKMKQVAQPQRQEEHVAKVSKPSYPDLHSAPLFAQEDPNNVIERINIAMSAMQKPEFLNSNK